MANFLIYPFKVMRITQSYTGTTSHLPHTTGTPKDYPLDEGDKDTGRSPMYCPCDEMKVVRIVGVGNNLTNGIWLTSTKKVVFADLSEDYVTILVYHPNDDDLKKIKLGQKFKRFDYMFREGNDGASGYHIHFSVGKGTMTGNGCVANSNGKYVLTTTDGTLKPEKAYAVDEKFTKVINAAGLKFKTLTQVEKAYNKKKETYTVTANLLNCRKTPSTKGAVVCQFKKGEKLEITSTKKADGLKWGKCSKGWVALKYCKK